MKPTLKIAVLAAALASGSAMANRPLNTDTADTITSGHCQFEPYAGSTRGDGQPSQHFVTPQLNCGLNERSQLGVSARDRPRTANPT